MAMFSLETVTCFVDIVYGENTEDDLDVNVEQLFQLFDYLQVNNITDVLTEIVSNIISVSTCERLYELSVAHHVHKLRETLEQFICNTMDIELVHEDLSDRAKLLLEKSPWYIFHPTMNHESTFNLPRNLMSYNSTNVSNDHTSISLKGGEVCQHYKPFPNEAKRVTYFTFHQELYAVVLELHMAHVIYKYHQHKREYSEILALSKEIVQCDGKVMYDIDAAFDILLIVVPPISKYVYMLIGPNRIDEIYLVNIELNDMPKATCYVAGSGGKYDEDFCYVYNERRMFKDRRYYTQKRIYKFSPYRCHAYDMNESTWETIRFKRALSRGELAEDYDLDTYCYCTFEENIYFIRYDGNGDEETLQFFLFNEDDSSWIFLCDFEIDGSVKVVNSETSEHDFAIVLHVEDEGSKLQFHAFDPDRMTLTLLKCLDTNYENDSLLFVPEFILDHLN